jgi:hypothetical protein
VQVRIAFYTIPLLLAPAWAENWPQWRGPSGTGVSRETGFPAEWSSTTNIAWKAPLRGLGVSTPIVWNDRVIVTGQIGANALRPGVPPTFVQGAGAAGEHPLGGPRKTTPAPRRTSCSRLLHSTGKTAANSGSTPSTAKVICRRPTKNGILPHRVQ